MSRPNHPAISQDISIVPGDWALKKILGPTFDLIGEDLSRLYAMGRANITNAALRKISQKSTNEKANLRVTYDVFMNGAFTNESICAEYFGGILASSRSEEGKDDSGVFYSDIVKSLSSNQLYLHYAIYNTLKKYFNSLKLSKPFNVGYDTELSKIKVIFNYEEILKFGIRVESLHALNQKSLIKAFMCGESKDLEYNNYENIKDDLPPYSMWIRPDSLGIQLYAISHNLLLKWQTYSLTQVMMPDFPGIELPQYSKVILK